MNIEIERRKMIDADISLFSDTTELNTPISIETPNENLERLSYVIELSNFLINIQDENNIENAMTNTENSDEVKKNTKFSTIIAGIRENYEKYSPTYFLYNLQENDFIYSFICMISWFCTVFSIVILLNKLIKLSIGFFAIIGSILIPKAIFLFFKNRTKKNGILFILDILFILLLTTGITFICLQDYKNLLDCKTCNSK